MDENIKLNRCDINNCKAMCCYDGVYLDVGEPEKIIGVVNKYPEYFKHLPKNYIVEGEWEGVVKGKKTAVKPYEYENKSFQIILIKRGVCLQQRITFVRCR